MSNERTLRVVLAQTKPRKNQLAANVARLKRALVPEADVMLFPETALSGYFLEGGVAEAALSRSELAEALGRPPGGCACDVAVGFYEKDRQGLYNSLAYLAPREDRYDVVHVHRKVFLPTYGLFDEARFVVPGSDVRAFDTRFGRMGMLVCEDLWHGLPAAVLALDGAEVILCAAASPARGFPGQEEAGRKAAPANLAAWNQVGSRTAREHGVFVAVSQLAGSEGGKVLSGGSAAWGPDGALVARGPLFASGSALAPLPMEDIARIRAKAPYLARLRAALPDLRRSLDRAARGDFAPQRPQDADGRGRAPGTRAKSGRGRRLAPPVWRLLSRSMQRSSRPS